MTPLINDKNPIMKEYADDFKLSRCFSCNADPTSATRKIHMISTLKITFLQTNGILNHEIHNFNIIFCFH